MKLKDIHMFVSNFDSYNIYDLLYQHNFSIIDYPMSCPSLIIPEKKTIFIQPNLEDNFKQFILWHEFGHYILHCSFSSVKFRYKQV